MSSDALVLEVRVPQTLIQGAGEQLPAWLPLTPDSNYVVFAKGEVSTDAGRVRLRLAVDDAVDETEWGGQARAGGGLTPAGSFSLAVPAAVPPLHPANAILYGVGEIGAATLTNIRIVAMTVENLTVTTPEEIAAEEAEARGGG